MKYNPTQVASYFRQKERREYNAGLMNIGYPILLCEDNDYLQNEESEYLIINEE
jgi:hypothetical protein